MIVRQYDQAVDKRQKVRYNGIMIDDDPDKKVTVALAYGKAYWVWESAMWVTSVDEFGEPDRDAAKIVDTEKMSFHEVKMHMSILDNLISEGKKQ